MVRPPLAGADQVTVTWGLAPLAMPVTSAAELIVGAAGSVAATVLPEVPAGLAPTPLVAVTE
jgi:hypothetical protein